MSNYSCITAVQWRCNLQSSSNGYYGADGEIVNNELLEDKIAHLIQGIYHPKDMIISRERHQFKNSQETDPPLLATKIKIRPSGWFKRRLPYSLFPLYSSMPEESIYWKEINVTTLKDYLLGRPLSKLELDLIAQATKNSLVEKRDHINLKKPSVKEEYRKQYSLFINTCKKIELYAAFRKNTVITIYLPKNKKEFEILGGDVEIYPIGDQWVEMAQPGAYKTFIIGGRGLGMYWRGKPPGFDIENLNLPSVKPLPPIEKGQGIAQDKGLEMPQNLEKLIHYQMAQQGGIDEIIRILQQVIVDDLLIGHLDENIIIEQYHPSENERKENGGGKNVVVKVHAEDSHYVLKTNREVANSTSSIRNVIWLLEQANLPLSLRNGIFLVPFEYVNEVGMIVHALQKVCAAADVEIRVVRRKMEKRKEIVVRIEKPPNFIYESGGYIYVIESTNDLKGQLLSFFDQIRTIWKGEIFFKHKYNRIVVYSKVDSSTGTFRSEDDDLSDVDNPFEESIHVNSDINEDHDDEKKSNDEDISAREKQKDLNLYNGNLPLVPPQGITVGIKNRGQTCWLNATLKFLSCTTYFDPLFTQNPPENKRMLHSILKHAINSLRTNAVISEEHYQVILNQVKEHFGVHYRVGLQNDASVFLSVLLNAFEWKPEEKLQPKIMTQYQPLQPLPEGYVKFSRPQKKPIIELAIPENHYSTHLSIADLIKDEEIRQIKPEKLRPDLTEIADYDFRTSNYFTYLPDTLMIYLKRQIALQNQPQKDEEGNDVIPQYKNSKPLLFEGERLIHLLQYRKEGATLIPELDCFYEITAAITHKGEDNKGHYVCEERTANRTLQVHNDSNINIINHENEFSQSPDFFRLDIIKRTQIINPIPIAL